MEVSCFYSCNRGQDVLSGRATTSPFADAEFQAKGELLQANSAFGRKSVLCIFKPLDKLSGQMYT
jgi:hypothetical protein